MICRLRINPVSWKNSDEVVITTELKTNKIKKLLYVNLLNINQSRQPPQ